MSKLESVMSKKLVLEREWVFGDEGAGGVGDRRGYGSGSDGRHG